MNKSLLSPIQEYWGDLEKLIYKSIAPVDYFEFNAESCRFIKNGKKFEIKIRELKNNLSINKRIK